MADCGPLDRLCDAAGGMVGGASSAVFDTMLNALGNAWVKAASSVLTTMLDALDATTQVDLSAAWFRANVQIIATITLPVVVALLTLQVITAVIRREPGALGRAVIGLAQAMLGTAIALGTTQALLRATDEVCKYIAGLSDDHAWILLSWIEETASSVVRTRSAEKMSLAAFSMAIVLSSGLDRRDCSVVASLLHRAATLAGMDYLSAIGEGLNKAGIFEPEAYALLSAAAAITPSTHVETGSGGTFSFQRRAAEFDMNEIERWLENGE